MGVSRGEVILQRAGGGGGEDSWVRVHAMHVLPIKTGMQFVFLKNNSPHVPLTSLCVPLKCRYGGPEVQLSRNPGEGGVP